MFSEKVASCVCRIKILPLSLKFSISIKIQTEANVWLTSVALDQLLRRLILVTYSQWRGKKFLIEHVVNVKTLNGSEHDGRSFFFHIFIEIENFRDKGKILMRQTYLGYALDQFVSPYTTLNITQKKKKRHSCKSPRFSYVHPVYIKNRIVNFWDLFLVEIYRKIKVNFYLLCLNYEQIKTTHINIMSK
jgi:hypothetical protein